MNVYREYFDIDPEYFPAVNSDVIKKDPSLWKKFYPHATFVKLVQDIVNVLNHNTNLNIWVEGAYGTGKSHAVITLKKLLAASVEETEAYFDEYTSLSSDLKKKFIGAKKNGKIVTVHRYGSSSINGDNDLFLAIQESIEGALKEAGIQNLGEDALKTSVIKYLSEPENKASFDVYVKGSYSDLFGCDTDVIIKKLQEYEGAALQELMHKIFKVANEKQIRAFTLSSKEMCEWIRSIIRNNELAELIFIWDEFTEYLINNQSRTTGFQELLEMSQTDNFCFIPVTHKSAALLDENSRNKILGRFIKPTCTIELPENTAFQLMGAALKKNENLKDEWEEIVQDLVSRTQDSRLLIKNEAHINEAELKGILPIHPFSAYVLKNISASFNSNQRSMFDFIKNKIEDSNIKAFQWFIGHIGPEAYNPLLTIDLLWSYFYESDKDALSPNIRLVLDNYSRLAGSLSDKEQRILKAVLLLQALSTKTNHTVAMLLPNEQNLNVAFEGSDLENNEAASCADKLVRDHVLFKKKIGRDIEIYSVLTGEIDSAQIDAKKKQFQEKKTSDLIVLESFGNPIELNNELKLRYQITMATAGTFESKFNQVFSKSESDPRHIYALATFAKNPSEASQITSKIKAAYNKNPLCNVVFIDCSRTPLGDEKFNEWVDFSAQSAYYLNKDKGMATTYHNYANNLLTNWSSEIIKRQIVLYSEKNQNGMNLANIDSLMDELHHLSLKRYSSALENMSVANTMWVPSNLPQGVECGISQQTKGAFKTNNVNTKLETALNGAWNVENYWVKSPSLLISKIKIEIDNLINQKLNEDGRISIGRIYDALKARPYGMLPCNLTAFIMGFILKEYVDGKYSWSDSLSRDELTLAKMQETIVEVIKNDMTPNPRYRDKFIVTMSREEKGFVDITANAFHINKTSCSTIEQARESIRVKMKGLIFPIWTLTEILPKVSTETSSEVVDMAIKLFAQLANNVDSGKTDSEIAVEIGKLANEHETLATDLSNLFTKEKCKEGMLSYLEVFDEGRLVSLAKQIDDGGQYINVIRQKFDADAAAWVWKKETVDEKIREAILEYEIIHASTPYVGKAKKISETFQHWSEKSKTIRLPFASVKNEVGELDNLLSELFEIVQTGRLHHDKLSQFLSNVEKFGSSFIAFCESQRNLFKKIYAMDLKGLSDEDVDNIFAKLQFGNFILDKVMFSNQLSNIIEVYKKQLGSEKLKKLWLEKTGTTSPKEWSDKYSMPISCMLTDDQKDKYGWVFSTVMKPGDTKSVDEAIVRLEKATFLESLSDASSRDEAFKACIIGQLSTLLTDIDEVKHYLVSNISAPPYNWMTYIKTIQDKLNYLAEQKYLKDGYKLAFSKIDVMNPEEVKSYLKEMIKNDMTVGIAILNS